MIWYSAILYPSDVLLNEDTANYTPIVLISTKGDNLTQKRIDLVWRGFLETADRLSPTLMDDFADYLEASGFCLVSESTVAGFLRVDTPKEYEECLNYRFVKI